MAGDDKGTKKGFTKMSWCGSEGLFNTTTLTRGMTADETKEFDVIFKDFDASFKKAGEGFDRADKLFDKSESITAAPTVEIVRATKEDCLTATDKFTVQGYTLDSIQEDKDLGVWKAKLSLKKTP